MIAIIDYDAGNTRSVEKAFQYLGEEVEITRDAERIKNASRVVLPGVGAFGDAMERLDKSGLSDIIRDVTSKGVPFLGICLGLQLLFDESEEAPGAKGLGILKGKVVRFDDENGALKIPHIGWNDLTFPKKGRLFEGIDEGAYVYFVHSYYLRAADSDIVAAKSSYGTAFDACQFHPEKSAETGLKILKNFLKV